MTTAQTESGAGGGPAMLRMLVGTQLRHLRESRGITREAAGWQIRASDSKISRMELGRVGFKERDVADLLTLYGIADEAERKALLDRVREANEPPWWRAYSDVAPHWFHTYLGLEAAASLIRTFELQFVPGLLQTEDYARAVVRLGHADAPPEEIDRRVALRMARKQLLTKPDAPRLWVVVDETALCRPIGGLAVMRAQLQALIEATQHRNVQLQVVPLHSGGHAAAGGSFTILRFDHAELPDVVYIEHLTSAIYLDRREDVDHYAATVSRLYIEAEPPDRTPEILTDILAHLSSTVE